MNASEPGDGFRPGAEGEVISVDENDLRAELLEDGVGQALDGALAGHGHKSGRCDLPVGGFEDRRPGRGGGVAGRDRERFGHWAKRKYTTSPSRTT